MGRERNRPPTILDVARESGFSKSLVSRVLLGQPPYSAEAGERIQRAASDLGYARNLQASSLASGRTGVVGVLARRITGEYYSTLMANLQAHADGTDGRIVCVTGNLNEEQEVRALETLLSLGVDGIIVGSGHLPNERVAAVAERLPTVVVGRDAPDTGADVVRTDAEGMARSLKDMAVGGRHTRALFITYPGTLSSIPGTEAITHAFGKAGITLDQRAGSYDFEPTVELARDILAEDAVPPLVVSLAGGASWALVRKFEAAGKRVPADVSILTYDTGMPDPRIRTTLSGTRQDLDALSEAAWRALATRIEDPSIEPRSTLVPGITVPGTTIAEASEQRRQ